MAPKKDADDAQGAPETTSPAMPPLAPATREPEPGDLTATTSTGDTVSISPDAPMPPPEPGHRIAETPGAAEGIFDPNAARRFAEGRGPGLQDSEALQPAHWVQDVDPRELTPEGRADYLAALEREREMAERAPAADAPAGPDTGAIDAEISRVKAEQQAADEAKIAANQPTDAERRGGGR